MADEKPKSDAFEGISPVEFVSSGPRALWNKVTFGGFDKLAAGLGALRNGRSYAENLAAQQAITARALEIEATKGAKLDAAVRATANFATFGYADNAAAAVGAATGVGGEFGEYKKSLVAQEARTKRDREEHPDAVAVGQGAGLALGYGGLKAGATLMGVGLQKVAGIGAEAATTGRVARTVDKIAEVAKNTAHKVVQSPPVQVVAKAGRKVAENPLVDNPYTLGAVRDIGTAAASYGRAASSAAQFVAASVPIMTYMEATQSIRNDVPEVVARQKVDAVLAAGMDITKPEIYKPLAIDVAMPDGKALGSSVGALGIGATGYLLGARLKVVSPLLAGFGRVMQSQGKVFGAVGSGMTVAELGSTAFAIDSHRETPSPATALVGKGFEWVKRTEEIVESGRAYAAIAPRDPEAVQAGKIANLKASQLETLGLVFDYRGAQLKSNLVEAVLSQASEHASSQPAPLREAFGNAAVSPESHGSRDGLTNVSFTPTEDKSAPTAPPDSQPTASSPDEKPAITRRSSAPKPGT